MIYQGLGNGNVIERNKARIDYVRSMSRDKVNELVNKLFDAFEMKFYKKRYLVCNEILEDLFYERIHRNARTEILEMYDKLDNSTIESLRDKIVMNCVNRPEKGFIWNIFHELNRSGGDSIWI